MTSFAGEALPLGDLSLILPVLTGDGPVGIALLDRDLRFLAVNEAAAASNGVPADDHPGRLLSELTPEVHDVVAPLMRQVLETGEPILDRPVSIEFPAGSGTLHHVVESFHPLRDDRGAVIGVGSIWWQVTERTFRDTVLRETEARFRRMADRAPVLMWVSGVDARCTWFNGVWLDWTGRTLDQEVGEGWLEGVHPEDLDRCRDIYLEAFARRESFEMEYRLRRADGSYGWVLDRGTPQYDPAEAFTGYVGSCTDITEFKRLQDRNAVTHERMQRLQAVTADLSRAVTREEASDTILFRVIPALGAAGAVTTVLCADGEHLEVVSSQGYPPEVIERLRRFRIDAPLPLAQAVRTRQRVYYESREEMLGDNPGIERLVQPRQASVVSVPLIIEGRVLGALGLSWMPARTLDPEELVFLDAVGAQLGQALERARLHEAEAEARRQAESAARRLAFLAETSRILGTSLDLQQTLSRLARMAVPRLADWCAVYLLDEQGEPFHVATMHTDPERVALAHRLNQRWPLRMDRPEGTARALSTGESTLYRQIPDELLVQVADDEEHLAAIRAVGLASGMSVALVHRDRVLGAITLANDAPRTADEADLALAEEFAARAASAVANAQAFSERARVARKLQASLLPARLPDLPGAQLSAGYLAAGEGEVGGDFYDAFAVGPDRWLLAIGDVRGKGVEAAAVTGLARHAIRSLALHRDTPGDVLRGLNAVLLSGDQEPDEEPLAIPRFCTVCAVQLERQGDGYLATVCSAGHPLPAVVRHGGRVEEVGKAGSLLGVFDEPELREDRVLLAPGDLLVCYTDGITERRHRGEFFEDELAGVLAGLAGADADTVTAAVQRAASEFTHDATLDDMALLVVRVTA